MTISVQSLRNRWRKSWRLPCCSIGITAFRRSKKELRAVDECGIIVICDYNQTIRNIISGRNHWKSKAAIHAALVFPFDMRDEPAYFRFFCQLKLHNNPTLVMYRSCGCEGFSTVILLLTNWIFLHARVDNEGNTRKNSLKHMTDDDDGRWRAHRFFPASSLLPKKLSRSHPDSARNFYFCEL